MNRLAGKGDVFLAALHPQFALPIDDGDFKFVFQETDIFVKGAEKINNLFQAFDADSLFQKSSLQFHSGP